MRVAAAALAFVLLAGCQRQSPRDAHEIVATASLPAATPTNSPTAIATVPPSQVRHAILDARGVSIGKNPGTADHFPFGAARADVEKAAAKWLVTAERSTNGECGAGLMEFSKYGGLTLNFQDGKLVGWLAKADPAIVTSDGIAPGKLLRDLQVARSAHFVEGSTLEGELSYVAADGQQIGGFASGTGRDAVVESLYAGVNCFFR